MFSIIKITAFVLLAAMLAPAGYTFIFYTRQQAFRQEMEEQLEKKILKTVVLSQNEVIWFKPGKEIIVDGKMFDVKSVVYSNDGTVAFTGLFDEEETLLVNQLREQQQKENSQGNKQLIQLLQLTMNVPVKNFTDESSLPFISAASFPDYTSSLASVYITILTPPPQI